LLAFFGAFVDATNKDANSTNKARGNCLINKGSVKHEVK